MSFSGLAPPPPFLPTPGRPSLPWEEWDQTLTVYLLASGAAEFPPARRKAILLHCLGAEGQRVYRTLPAGSNAAAPASTAAPEVQEKPPAATTDEYEAALIALRQQFSTSCNVVVERHRFHHRSQHAGESVHDFVAALRELVSHCSFASQDDALWDRSVAGVVSSCVRERLLLEGSSFSFESAVRIALQFEQAPEELKEFSALVEPVSVRRRSQYSHSSRKFNYQPKAHFQQSSPSASGSRAPQGPRPTRRDRDSRSVSPHCFRCGSRNHRASASQCPAQGKKCLFCGIKGHFQKVFNRKRQMQGRIHEVGINDDALLLSLDIIERIDASEWVSPIVVVDKKDGTIRICADIREPNKAIVPDRFPLPHTQELLHVLEEFKQAVFNDGCLQTVKSFVLGSWPPQKSIPEEAKPFYSVREELSVVDDLLLSAECLVVPSSLTAQFIAVAHEAHPGITRTKARLHGHTLNASKLSRVPERGTSPPYQRLELPAPQLLVQVPQPALPPPLSPWSQPPPPGVLQSAVPQSPAPDPQLPVPEPAMLWSPSPKPQSRSPGVLQSSTSSLPSPAVQHPHLPS
nr:uncharacterized protein LOC119186720 [Rhipicephalus microplus]